MEVGVKVLSEDPLSGRQAHCCTAYVTMVALDASAHPTPVPRLVPDGRDARRRQREAQERRQARLRRRERKVRRPA
jgi:acyl-CoA hydrolase